MPLTPVAVEEKKWYAVQTRSRHEKAAEKYLCAQGVTTFLPMITEIHHWSDRKKIVECPLFSGYTFVRLAATTEERIRVLRTHGVVNFVGTHGIASPIPDEQIEAVKALMSSNVPFTNHQFLKVGQRVRVREGALDGVEGILVSHNGGRNLVISVDAIQRSLCIQIEGYKVEPL